jgi:hypothetical protein
MSRFVVKPASAAGVAWAAATILFAPTMPVLAQTWSYGVPGAHDTQQAVQPPPGVSEAADRGLYAGLGIATTRHTNTLRTSEIEAEDTEIALSPTLLYRQDFGRHQAQIGYTANVITYQDFSSQDVTAHNLDAAVSLWPGEVLSFGAFAGYGKGYETRGASGTRIIGDVAPDDFDSTRFGISALLGRAESTMQFGVGYSQSSWRYTNNEQQDRDHDDDTISGRVYYNYSPITAFFLEANFTDIAYQQVLPKQDSTETSYLVGVRTAPTAALSGEIAYGVLTKEYDDPAIAGYDDNTYRARVRWVPVDRLGFNLFASRTTEESAERVSDFFVSDLIGVGVDYALTSRIRASAFYNRINDDYPETGRADTINDWALGLDYAVADWLSVGLRYGQTGRDSNVPEAVYDDEYIGLTIGLQTQFGAGSR